MSVCVFACQNILDFFFVVAGWLVGCSCDSKSGENRKTKTNSSCRFELILFVRLFCTIILFNNKRFDDDDEDDEDSVETFWIKCIFLGNSFLLMKLLAANDDDDRCDTNN